MGASTVDKMLVPCLWGSLRLIKHWYLACGGIYGWQNVGTMLVRVSAVDKTLVPCLWGHLWLTKCRYPKNRQQKDVWAPLNGLPNRCPKRCSNRCPKRFQIGPQFWLKSIPNFNHFMISAKILSRTCILGGNAHKLGRPNDFLCTLVHKIDKLGIFEKFQV